jgi:hypothetical protein
LLLALTAGNFSLGKAYGMGVDLAETVLVSYKLCTKVLQPSRSINDDMSAVFAPSRVNRIAREIRDMKGDFAPYASDAVSATLIDWGQWVRSAPSQSAVNWPYICGQHLYPQGQDWRALLSGEKKPTDELQVPDYVAGLRHLLGRYWELFRGFAGRWTALVPVVVLIFLAGATVALWNVHQLPAAWATAVSFFGLFGLSGATVMAAVKNALNQTEQHLWQAEQAAAIAAAIDKVPGPVDQSAVGSLAGDPKYRKKGTGSRLGLRGSPRPSSAIRPDDGTGG